MQSVQPKVVLHPEAFLDRGSPIGRQTHGDQKPWANLGVYPPVYYHKSLPPVPDPDPNQLGEEIA